jgi:hypothetical protein
MNQRRFHLAIAALILLATVAACSFSVSTAKIEEAWMAADEEGSQRTAVFAQDATFYAIVDLANAPDDTTVRAAWTAVEVEGADPDTFIDETEVTTGSGNVVFQLNNSNLWPVGHYKVDLYLDDKLDRTLEFDVQP